MAADSPDPIILTDEGLAESRRVVRNHRLWELFLTQEAKLAADHVHADAEYIEHVLPRVPHPTPEGGERLTAAVIQVVDLEEADARRALSSRVKPRFAGRDLQRLVPVHAEDGKDQGNDLRSEH